MLHYAYALEPKSQQHIYKGAKYELHKNYKIMKI